MDGGQDDEGQIGDPAQAFEDLRAEVSVMRRAVEGLPRALAENLPPAPPDVSAGAKTYHGSGGIVPPRAA